MESMCHCILSAQAVAVSVPCRVVGSRAKAAMGQAGQQRSRQKKICNKQLGARWRWVLLPTFDLCSIYGYQSGWTMLMKIFRGVPYGDGSENPMLLVFRGNHYLINPIYPIWGLLKMGDPQSSPWLFHVVSILSWSDNWMIWGSPM